MKKYFLDDGREVTEREWLDEAKRYLGEVSVPWTDGENEEYARILFEDYVLYDTSPSTPRNAVDDDMEEWDYE